MKDRAYEIALNPKYDGYQRRLLSMVYRFLNKETGSRMKINEVLAQELHKPIIQNLKREMLIRGLKIILEQ